MTDQASSSGRRAGFGQFAGEFSNFVEDLLPPEQVRQHFRNSRIEFWKGVRALVDLRIEHLGRQGKSKGEAVTVE